VSTRCLIGVLGVDGRTYRARYCHNDGYPTHLLPALGEALHEHHDGDLPRLAAAILEADWSSVAPSKATMELADASTRSAQRADHLQPVSGVGYHDTEHLAPEPRIGAVDEETDGAIKWLYLMGDDQIRVHHAVNGGWEDFGHFTLVDLKSLDLTDLHTRESAADARAATDPELRDDRRYTVLVRFPEQKRALRATPDGRTTNRKIHASILTRAEAERVVELSRAYLAKHEPGARMWIAPF